MAENSSGVAGDRGRVETGHKGVAGEDVVAGGRGRGSDESHMTGCIQTQNCSSEWWILQLMNSNLTHEYIQR